MMLRWESAPCVVGTNAVAVTIPEVLILSAVPTPVPVNAEPSPEKDVAVHIPVMIAPAAVVSIFLAPA